MLAGMVPLSRLLLSALATLRVSVRQVGEAHHEHAAHAQML